NRANINWSLSFLVALGQQPAMLCPELMLAAPAMLRVAILQQERCRHVWKGLGDPLAAIGVEYNQVSPPLTRQLMRKHYFIVTVRILHAQLVADGRVKVITDGKVYQPWPRLPVIAGGLLCHGQALIGEFAEEVRENVHRQLGFPQGFLHQAYCTHASQSGGD